MDISEVTRRLEAAVDEAGSQLKFAFPNQVSQSHVSEVLKGTAEPSDKLLAVLGLERVVTYQERQSAAAA